VLVEGLFDWASLWQAGFRTVTCSLGTKLNATQFYQLCDDAVHTVYLAFDSDANGSGQRAAHQIAQRESFDAVSPQALRESDIVKGERSPSPSRSPRDRRPAPSGRSCNRFLPA